MLKSMKKSFILTAIVYIVAGIVLVIWPETTTKTICYSLGLVIIGFGLVHMWHYMKESPASKENNYELVWALLAVAFGIFSILKWQKIVSIIPIILGFAIVFNGLIKLKRAIDLERMHNGSWWHILLLAIANIIFGGILLANPFEAASTLIRVIGIGLIYSGITDFLTLYWIAERSKQLQQDLTAIDEEEYK